MTVSVHTGGVAVGHGPDRFMLAGFDHGGGACLAAGICAGTANEAVDQRRKGEHQGARHDEGRAETLQKRGNGRGALHAPWICRTGAAINGLRCREQIATLWFVGHNVGLSKANLDNPLL